MDKKSVFHERLKEARKNAGLTQKELAQKTGIAARTICTYERDKLPGLEGTAKIADALSVSVDWLLGRSDAGDSLVTFVDAFVWIEKLETILGGCAVKIPKDGDYPSITFYDSDRWLSDFLTEREQLLSLDTTPELKERLYSIWRAETISKLKRIVPSRLLADFR